MLKYKLFLSLFICVSFCLNAQDSKAIKIWRTTTNWNEIISFPVDNITISANETKYIHIDVYYDSQPDIAISVDALNENSDGTNLIRPITPYTNFGGWQTLVFPIAVSSTNLDIKALLIYPDIGEQNTSSKFVLNSLNSFGYVDNIVLKNSSTLSIENTIKVETLVSIFPNPSKDNISITSSKKIEKVIFYNSLGKEVTKNINKIYYNRYGISNLVNGIYFMKVTFENGENTIKKIIKN